MMHGLGSKTHVKNNSVTTLRELSGKKAPLIFQDVFFLGFTPTEYGIIEGKIERLKGRHCAFMSIHYETMTLKITLKNQSNAVTLEIESGIIRD